MQAKGQRRQDVLLHVKDLTPVKPIVTRILHEFSDVYRDHVLVLGAKEHDGHAQEVEVVCP